MARVKRKASAPKCEFCDRVTLPRKWFCRDHAAGVARVLKEWAEREIAKHIQNGTLPF